MRAAFPLSLSEQLDAMLMGWLEHRAGEKTAGRPGLKTRALITVAPHLVDEVERFCARWEMTVERVPVDDVSWVVLYIDGPALPVEGFSAITRMYRR
jgi:hypothetical protein